MKGRALRVALLLFGSGLTALVYQVAWLRELRLVFGASTAASSAVVAIFLGGLGAGSWVLGRRVDALERPLLFYGRLELSIAGLAAVSPLFVWLARLAYIALGGSTALGSFGGTLVRLVLSAVVLGAPTFLMGGTLPAATRAVQTDEDPDRRRVALLYAANTLGAVIGASLANFVLLERAGTRGTLWSACAVNFAVGVLASVWGKEAGARERVLEPSPTSKKKRKAAAAPAPVAAAPVLRSAAAALSRFVLFAAAVVGFAFMLMELVWYRMLAPLLGGSTYSFGLILAVALLGIGLGAVLAAARRPREPATLGSFAATCGLEALFLVIPFALGDRVALLAIFSRAFGAFGFSGYVASWTAVTALVVFPAAFVAGIQFPLLIALLGRGREAVGRDVGLAYAANTLGGIAGALAGGFGLLPVLSAPGTWRLVAFLLVLLAAISTFRARAGAGSARRRVAVALASAASALALATTAGPTAAWRHSPIGAGRVELEKASPNVLTHWLHERRRHLAWQADGVESSVALLKTSDGYAFALNGKIDGSSRGDAATQVMGGLLGAALQPAPRRALVIGLGTGSTAGWLAAVPSIERVDVLELEPAVLEVGRASAPVNENALANRKVRVVLGDAREILLTGRDRYDVIFSEPSNPYRAGISSLFTREFYRSVRSRLAPGGLFVQWMQAYEVDGETIRTVYATLASAFPAVETWRAKSNDLLLVGSEESARRSVPDLRARLATEPFRTAIEKAWRVSGLEGFLSHFLATDALTRTVAREEGDRVNTDDRNRIEFALARTLGQTIPFESEEIRRLAKSRGEDRPALDGQDVDWALVDRDRMASTAAEGPALHLGSGQPNEELRRAAIYSAFIEGRLEAALAAWRAEGRPPDPGTELTMVAEALAQTGDSAAPQTIHLLAASQPTEAASLSARWFWRQGRLDDAARELARAFTGYREDPWPLAFVMKRSLAVAADIAAREPRLAPALADSLSRPFAVRVLEDERLAALLEVAAYISSQRYADALSEMEPNVPWERRLLSRRAQAYASTGSPLAARARADWELFQKREPRPFSEGLETKAQ